MLSIATIKSHAESFISSITGRYDVSYHNLVREFATFIEGKEAEVDAIALLTARGYTVTAPPSAPV